MADPADICSLSVVPPPRRHGLSKSRIAVFEQCAKRLWLSVHRPELGHDGAATVRSFQVGHEVGAVACSLYPDGIMIEAAGGMTDAARVTAEALRTPERRPIFEATFIHDGVVVRVDLLLPEGNGWHVVEVKSTTRVKPYHRADLATQLWVMRACGVAVTRASIRVIDPSFVLRAAGDYRGLFVDAAADAAVTSAVDSRPAIVAAANDTLAGGEPMITVGAHCSDPFHCSFETYCRRDLPPAPEWPTTLLPGSAGKALAGQLAAAGLDDLMAVDQALVTRPLLQRVHQATQSGVAFHDAASITAETAGWSYPRTFLDFESIAFAVPRWLGTRPYQQVPFQFSAHVDRGDGELQHLEFLSVDGDDPRARCAAALTALPSCGAVVAWNAAFERSCLLALADHLPAHGLALRSLANRLVDLLPVARRHYYHRDMRGSWSIKAVLPTLAPELDYRLLAGARSGIEAQELYLEALDPSTTTARHQGIRSELLAYCERDTLAMAVLLERLCSAIPPGTIQAATSPALR